MVEALFLSFFFFAGGLAMTVVGQSMRKAWQDLASIKQEFARVEEPTTYLVIESAKANSAVAHIRPTIATRPIQEQDWVLAA